MSDYHITTLKRLILACNKFEKFPKITSMANIDYLDIGFNDINILPYAINDMESLKTLIIARNALRMMPFPHRA